MKMEYTIVHGSSGNPNDFVDDELDIVYSTFDELEIAKNGVSELEKERQESKGQFKIYCRQVTDWCEVLMK